MLGMNIYARWHWMLFLVVRAGNINGAIWWDDAILSAIFSSTEVVLPLGYDNVDKNGRQYCLNHNENSKLFTMFQYFK